MSNPELPRSADWYRSRWIFAEQALLKLFNSPSLTRGDLGAAKAQYREDLEEAGYEGILVRDGSE